MARVKTNVDATILQSLIQELEAKAGGAFPSRRELFAAAAPTYTSRTNVHVTPAILAARFSEFNLVCKSPPGKRGRPKGSTNRKTVDSAVRPVAEVRRVSPLGEIVDGGDEVDIDDPTDHVEADPVEFGAKD